MKITFIFSILSKTQEITSTTFTMYIVSNLKCHVKSSPFVLNKKMQDIAKKCKNFYVIHAEQLSFVIFPSIGFINISGIKRFEDIKTLPQILFRQFQIIVQSDNIIIDNSTASGKLTRCQSHALFSLNFGEDWVVNLRPHIFPAAVIRPKHRKGSIILFANGKFIIVGSKSLDDIDYVYLELQQKLNHV